MGVPDCALGAVKADPALLPGVNISGGQVHCAAVAEALGLKSTPYP